MVVRAAAVRVVRLMGLALALGRGQLGLFVAVLRYGGCGRGGLFTDGVVDRDRDPDRAAALAAQRLGHDRREPSLEYALRELVRHGEQRGVGDQRERLAAPDPVFILRLDALPTALPEELLQNSWPHCGKIGRYVSHRARSLAGPTKVWFWDGSEENRGGAVRRERIGVQPR